MSCRQDDESSIEETFQSSLKQENNEVESQRNSIDSTVVENAETDPPRDSSHWKVEETNQTKKTDSLSLVLEVNPDNGPKDPPRDSSHWKGK
ncbi:hypothetical protein LPB90_06825 [Chryseobacterium sp. LC2016-29]|uniref:hypothetical protein n=1 Tax=Chryseobacterium sp. LC2016-29 TaxID=2897331 RepID=UPI001E52D395|nr:hypothetical protein [Chryseobacterium sp. LC2016-29]MCD0478164.1 hypothetical protein [Chryseobacterium sp. LC2016-29]